MTRDQRHTVKAAIRRYRIAEMQNDHRRMAAYRRAVQGLLGAYRKAS